MKRWLAGVLILIGLLVVGCEMQSQGQPRDTRLSDVRPQVEVTVQQ